MSQFLRPTIRAMAGYTPGEQPRAGGFVKLNTNENPYPPSPRVFEVDPEAVLVGNGSDDILTMVTRAFVPEGGLVVSPTPSYLLYRTLAEIQGARYQAVPYTPDWQLFGPWRTGQ